MGSAGRGRVVSTTVWILGDQLLDSHPALLKAEEVAQGGEIRVLLVESKQRLRRLPYQRKKLVLLFSAMRHYAARLRDRGYTVDYRMVDRFSQGMEAHLREHQPQRLLCMEASEYRGRRYQRTLESRLGVPTTVLSNTQFLVGSYDPYPDPDPDKRYVMEHFYRAMRRHFNLLMDEAGEPLGGRWNYDDMNRKPLPKGLEIPRPIQFPPDEITRQLIDEVESSGWGVGNAAGFQLAVTHEQARQALEDFIAHRLVDFGPYEDAMSRSDSLLYHSGLSPYLNLGLLEPAELATAAASAYLSGAAPINSVEGFIRQVIGWREYIYWQYWRQMPAMQDVNFWDARRSLPEFFWDARTPMNCMQAVIQRALDDGYTHHIERLMVLSNFCLLAGIEPQQVNDWFLSCYVDAYEWVMLPNVLGMGLYADGGQTGTKPYIASANYINKMSDYCQDCEYDRRKRTGPGACPFNLLYWNFLIEHESVLRASPRMGPNVLSLRHIDDEERTRIVRQARDYLQELGSGPDP